MRPLIRRAALCFGKSSSERACSSALRLRGAVDVRVIRAVRRLAFRRAAVRRGRAGHGGVRRAPSLRSWAWAVVVARMSVTTSAGQGFTTRFSVPRSFPVPARGALIGVLARERVRLLAGDGADLADLVAAAPQVGANGGVVSTNLRGQSARPICAALQSPWGELLSPLAMLLYAPLRLLYPANVLFFRAK